MTNTYYILEHENLGYLNPIMVWSKMEWALKFPTLHEAAKKRNEYGPSIRPLIHFCEMKISVERLDEK